MYVHRLVMKDAPGLPDRDLTFWDNWTEKPIRNVLLTGPNGTGKTAILRTITSLWDLLGAALTQTERDFNWYAHTVERAGLVAMEIRDLAPQPLWVFAAQSRDIPNSLIPEDSLKAGGYWKNTNDKPMWVDVPGKDEWPHAILPLVQKAREVRLTGMLGNGAPFPNMVFLEASNRLIQPHTSSPIGPEPYYRWLTTYDEQSRASPLETHLRNLKIRDEVLFQKTLEHFNRFLKQNGKRLPGFDSDLRLPVVVERLPGRHYIDDLSSGEQQCLILIFMLSRWLMPGGVALIDEPDLHLHGSWQPQMMSALQQLVVEKGGQLIVTSHAELITHAFGESQRFHLELESQQA